MSYLTLQIGDPVFDATILAQATAANPRTSIWASANAGAGKTKVLIDRIARLLLAGAQPGRVLAVTYTKAAAAEMQTRLYDKLGSWTIASDADLRRALKELDESLDLDSKDTLARARALFARALETPGGLKIQTIHAFCQTILQRFPLEAGVPPGFQILDDATRTILSDNAFHAAAQANPAIFLELAALTSQTGDRDAVRSAITNRAAMSAIAMAENSIVSRLSETLGDFGDDTPETIRARAISSFDIEALSQAAGALETGGASDKAAAAAFRLVAQNGDGKAIWAALMGLIWTNDGDRRKKQIYTKPMAKQAAVTAVLGSHDHWPSDFCETLEAADHDMRACGMLRRSVAFTQAALAYHTQWTGAKRAMGALDFDDLVSATAALLGSSEGAAQWVLYKLDAGIEHILIDEAQDTSPDQWDLMAPLFAALEQEPHDSPRTRFVVGDEKQSIFSFQGARPERFALERDKFEEIGKIYQDGRCALSFDLSFRTGQTILDAVDAVWTLHQIDAPSTSVEASDAQFQQEEKYAFKTNHKAFRDGQPGVVELWPLTWAGEKGATQEAWDQPQDIEREDSARNILADNIALELKDRLDRGMNIWDKDVTRPMVPSDVMVLVKKRGPLFHQLIRRLKFHKVPVAGADRIKLVEDAAIQDLIALARFALLPSDDFNLACVLKGAFCGLIDEDVHLFPLAWDRGENSLWSRLCESGRADHAKIINFLASVRGRGGRMPPYEFFASILERPLITTGAALPITGWHAMIERLGREVREPVEAFLSRALDHGKSGAPTLQAFLDQIETDGADVKREMDQGGSGVRVMTVHGAKGLEAPVVILPDTTSNMQQSDSNIQFDHNAAAFLWSPQRGGDTDSFKSGREEIVAQQKGEDARLLYVAMTRARDLLILCGHQSGNCKDGMPSACWYRTFTQAMPLLGESDTIVRPTFSFETWGAYPPKGDHVPIQLHDIPDTLPDWINSPPPGEAQGPRRIAPSALAPEGSEPPALSPLAPDARKRFLRGRLIHELLQRLPDLPADQWRIAGAKRLKREADLDDEARAAILSETCAVLEDPKFAAIFGPGSRAEAAIVGRGVGLPDDMVVNGQVDRLVVTPTQVLVLDFKTNRPPPIHVDDVAQVYLNQMAAYRALLQANWPDKGITCALLWTDGPRLMELPDVRLDQALQVIAALPR
jgi:ATP-dependent helicase/nuclease subunit A